MRNFKKSTSFIIALTLAFSTSFLTSVEKVQAQEPTGSEQKQVIIVMKDKGSSKIKSLELKAKGKPVKEYNYVHSLKTNLSNSEIINLKNDPNILSVEEDTKMSIIQGTEIEDWGIAKVGAEQSWNSGLTGLGVKIAIIDTGIDTDHPDFATATTGAAAAIAGGTCEIDGKDSYEDDNGHGTHVAGIIGARKNGTGIVGVAPEASLYAVKALDSSGSGYTSDIIGGIDWSIQNHMDIISMSLGSKYGSTALQNACDTAYSDGILVVAAAGNTGTAKVSKTADTINYPAKYNSVIAVGAVDSSNNRAYFSSTGKELEVVAPGVKILSDYLNGTYKTLDGTSMATPFVSGDLALLKQKYSDYTNEQLRALLNKSVTDLGTAGKDNLFGNGLIIAPVK